MLPRLILIDAVAVIKTVAVEMTELWLLLQQIAAVAVAVHWCDYGCDTFVLRGVTLTTCRGCLCAGAEHCIETTLFFNSCGVSVTYLSHLIEAQWFQVTCGLTASTDRRFIHSTLVYHVSVALKQCTADLTVHSCNIVRLVINKKKHKNRKQNKRYHPFFPPAFFFCQKTATYVTHDAT